MKSFIPKEAAGFVQKHKNYKRYAAVFVCLAIVVAVGTMVGLRLYGQAMTKTVKVLDCRYVVHTHTDECYLMENGKKTDTLICGQADYVVHIHNLDCYDELTGKLACKLPEIKEHEHTDACYRETRELICGQEAVPAHTHDESCMGEIRELTCGLEETEPHTHTDDCYTVKDVISCGMEEHTHSDACYTTETIEHSEFTCSQAEHSHGEGCYDEEGNLICGQAEHSHGDGCYTVTTETNTELTCGMAEHAHSDSCHTTQSELTCGKEETAGHTHDDSCYTVTEGLICGKEETEGHTHSAECYEETVELTCREKETHTHTEDCYITEEDIPELTEEDKEELTEKGFDVERLADYLYTTEDEDGNELKVVYTCGKLETKEHTHSGVRGQVIEDEESLAYAPEENKDEYVEDGCFVLHVQHFDPNTEPTAAPDPDATGEPGIVIGGPEDDEPGTDDPASDEPGADAELICGKEEHTHTSDCYTNEKTLVCGLEEGEGHTHTDACYHTNPELTLTCGKEEHTHTADCYAGAVEPTEPQPRPEDYTNHLDCTVEGEGIHLIVSASFNDDAEIPEGAELQAKFVTDEAYERRVAEAKEVLNGEIDESHAPMVLNIGFFLDGEEIEPATPVTITVQMMGENGLPDGKPVTVVHFPNEEGAQPEVLDGGNLEDGSTSFTTNSFSDFTLLILNGDDLSIKKPGDMGGLLRGVTIKDNKGEEVTDGKLYVGESYTIHMEFKEGGAQGGEGEQFKWTEDDTLTFQIPSSFQVDKYENMELKITVGDQEITVGYYSIDENGLLTLKLTDEGKAALLSSNDFELTFDMTATAQATEEGDDQNVHFGDVGSDFNFTVTDQPRLDVQKSGGFQEGAEGNGGTLSYTVTTTVEHGTVENAQITDVLTPPQTDAIVVGDYKNVKVTLKRATDDPDGEAIELDPNFYDLVPGEPDPANPGKQTFIVKLKDPYATLYEGDVLNVSYEYDVDYNMSGVGLLNGSVFNEVTVNGTMPLEDPNAPEGKPPVEVEEKHNSNVWINVATTGDGVIFKDQHYDEATHKLHYTLYTVIPKGTWEPLFIQDDMYVNYGGERWYIEEFSNGDSRVDLKSLTVRAVDLPDEQFDWKDTENPDQLQGDLQSFVEKAKELTGFDFYTFGDNSKPEGYKAMNEDKTTNVDQYVYYFADRTMYIIFGFDHTRNYNDYWGSWGSWNYDKDRLVITEYDLDLSGETELTVKSLDTTKTRTLTPEQILHAGVTNNVNLRFSKYNPGYVTFFNYIKDIDKTGVPDKNTNTIDYTVTVGLSDDTVRDYFKEVGKDVYASFNEHNSWDYQYTMQAEFYDVLPEGWEYVPGSLYAVTTDRYGNTTTFAYLTERGPELSEDGRSISAPLINFFAGRLGSFDGWSNDDLTEISFHYKLKASRDWLMKHAEDESAVDIKNHAEIKDKNMSHWGTDETVPYLPNRLTKTAEQVGETNLIKFTLEMNQAGADLDPSKNYLIVKDESTGLEIKPGSIVVSQVKEDGTVVPLTNLGAVTLDTELGSDQWGQLPEEVEHQFKLKVPDGVPLRITYQALVTESGESVPVTNSASIDGVERSNSDYDKALKVNDISAGGSGSTYELTFEKVDSTDSSKKLSDAKFQFYIVRKEDSGMEETERIKVGEQEYSCYTKPEWVITTGENGTFLIGGEERNWNLEPGNYYILVETKAPAGYEELEEPVLFYFGPKNQVDTENYPGATYALPSGTLTVGDPQIPYSLPETGGTGPQWYTLGGMLLFGSALVYIAFAGRRRKTA